MTDQTMQRVAGVVRRWPWAVAVARSFYRFTQPKFSAGVVGVVFNDEGQVLLVEHVFHPYTPWGLPGGWVGRRESPGDTVMRELEEELQLTIEVGPVLLAEVDEPHQNHLDFAFLCRKTSHIGRISRELLGYRWCNVDDLPRLHEFHYRAIVIALEYQNSGL